MGNNGAVLKIGTALFFYAALNIFTPHFKQAESQKL